jgi:leucyl aminopeptidase (aminopeptidase T)
LPDCGSYNPEPVEFSTFSKILTKGKSELKKTNMPTEERFKDPTKSKATGKVLVPGPG